MKKLSAYLMSIILIFSLAGCNTDNNKETEAPDAYSSTKEPAYIGEDIDQFVEAWKSAHTLKQSDNRLYTTTANSNQPSTLTVPVLQTTDFALDQLLVYYWSTTYFFTPTQSEEPLEPLSKIRIIISDKLTYKIDWNCLFFEDGNIVYNSFRNVWYIHIGSATARIIFPKDIVLSSPEQISEYFTFETYTAEDGNDHVVS